MIRAMPFLWVSWIQLDGLGFTMSSCISLKALAIKTTARGSMVVQRPVGDTFGTCWMMAEYQILCSNPDGPLPTCKQEEQVCRSREFGCFSVKLFAADGYSVTYKRGIAVKRLLAHTFPSTPHCSRSP